MAAAFRKCGLFPVDRRKATKRIPSRNMDVPETIREQLNPNQGEKLDQLRGTGGKEKAKGRGQKIKVVPGKSYSAPVVDSWEDDEEEEGLDEVEVNSEGSEEQMAVQCKGTRKAHSKDSESNLQLLKPVVFALEFYLDPW